MIRCMDIEHFHFIECDADCAYWAVAGGPKLNCKQAFHAIITDKKFYDENVHTSALMKLATKAEQRAREKKLLGLAMEKRVLIEHCFWIIVCKSTKYPKKKRGD